MSTRNVSFRGDWDKQPLNIFFCWKCLIIIINSSIIISSSSDGYNYYYCCCYSLIVIIVIGFTSAASRKTCAHRYRPTGLQIPSVWSRRLSLFSTVFVFEHRRARSASASAQSDQGLCCPLIRYAVYVSGQWKPWSDCANEAELGICLRIWAQFWFSSRRHLTFTTLSAYTADE